MIYIEMPLWLAIIIVICFIVILIYFIVGDLFARLMHNHYQLILREREKEKRRTKMSKELEALESIKDLLPHLDKPYIKIIETALKNYQELLDKPCVIMRRTHGQTKSMIDYVCKNWKEVKITNLEDDKKLKTLEILKAFGFEIEDYTEDEHGSIKVKCNRIILDDEEIDIAKEVLL